MENQGQVAGSRATEFEIDLLAFIRLLLARKILLLGIVASAVAAGWGASQVLPKKYKSTVTFAFQAAGGASSRLQQLAMLAGNMEMGQGNSPFISHLETFAQSREVAGRMMGLRHHDSSLVEVLLGRRPTSADSLHGFHGKLNSVCKLTRKADIFDLTCVIGDPVLAANLSQGLFSTLAEIIEEKRRIALGRKLAFVDSILETYRKSYGMASDRLKTFTMNNMGVTSPELLQRRESLAMEKRIAEERYILSIKEQEELRIQHRQQEEPLIVLEDAFVPPAPFFPSLPKMVATCLAVFFFLYVAAIAWFGRKAWLRPI